MNSPESPSKSLAEVIMHRLSGSEPEWSSDLVEMFSGLSDDLLQQLDAQSIGLDELERSALDVTISDYYWGDRPQDNSDAVSDPMDQHEFFFRVAFVMTPVSVAYHLPMIGNVVRSYHGDEEELSEDDLYMSVSNSIHNLVANLTPTERNVQLANGFFLCDYYASNKDHPAEADIQWLSEHALELTPYFDRVFANGFDRGLAETLIAVETPTLREGVL